MKNKIGILENDIYIFPIVNSVNLLSVNAPFQESFFKYGSISDKT